MMEEKEWVDSGDLPVVRSRIEAFARLAVALAFVAVVVLMALGVIDADRLKAAVASCLAIVGLVAVWWRDNNVTMRAILRHEVGIEIEEDDAK